MRDLAITRFDPPLWAQLSEMRCLWERRDFLRDRTSLLSSCRKGDGSPVLVIPGFLAGDPATEVLRAFLTALGYTAYGWQQGVNIGPTKMVAAQLVAQVQELHRKHQRKVTLIGWSLGGIYARELARVCPMQIRMVVTLGSPLSGSPSGWLWTLFQLLNWRTLKEITAQRLADRSMPVPVRSVALYSRRDGIVNWECCTAPACQLSSNVEVESSHVGMVYSTDALRCIAEQIAMAIALDAGLEIEQTEAAGIVPIRLLDLSGDGPLAPVQHKAMLLAA